MKISACAIIIKKIYQDHTHTYTQALTDLLIKTDSVLAHLINPQRQLPGENRPHYARTKTMTPSASRDSFANGRAEREEGSRSGSMSKGSCKHET